METRANYVLVGAFSLIALLSAFFFAIWLAKTNFDRRFSTYDIFFAGSVAGLKTGGDVLYNGIRVGEARLVRLAPRDPSRVQVRIEVDSATPVGEDTVASLELQGLTGVAAIQLSGGNAESGALPTMPGEDYPIIRSKRSTLDELIQGVPGILKGATEVMAALSQVLSPENRDSVAATLHNVATITGQWSDPKSDAGRLIVNAADTMGELRLAAGKIKGLIDKLDRLAATSEKAIGEDARPLLQDARETLRSLQTLSDNLDHVVTTAQPGVTHFANQGLPQITATAADLRQLTITLDRVLRRLESDPARFLLGDQKAGVPPP